MNKSDPISLLFEGMEKLGPGDNALTRHVLRLLPKRDLRTVVDAGCGSGRQTLVLVSELGTLVYAIDSHQPFLDELVRRAEADQVHELVDAKCMDMRDIPQVFQGIDLLWSEGGAYNIGFAHALATWAPALNPGGFVVVSELSWLKESAPNVVREFFRSAYPSMRTVQDNVVTAENAGYNLLATRTLPEGAWVDGYYEVLEPRAKALLDHTDASVRDIAAETLKEIQAFHHSENSYGYVFYALQRV